jgi:hypothetical protein
MTENVRSSVGEAASDAGERVSDLATRAGSSAMDVGEGFWDMVRRNPVPAALTGLGLAWLLTNREETRFHPIESVSDRLPNVPINEFADEAKGRISDLPSDAQMQARRAQSQLDRMMRDTPLAVGAAALGIGAAVGLAVPTTSRERELMGDARQTLVEKTQQAAADAQQRLMTVAKDVQETVVNDISGTSGSQQSAQDDAQKRLSRAEEHQDAARKEMNQAKKDLQNPQSRAS